jgi:hypothetical protein
MCVHALEIQTRNRMYDALCNKTNFRTGICILGEIPGDLEATPWAAAARNYYQTLEIEASGCEINVGKHLNILSSAHAQSSRKQRVCQKLRLVPAHMPPISSCVPSPSLEFDSLVRAGLS